MSSRNLLQNNEDFDDEKSFISKIFTKISDASGQTLRMLKRPFKLQRHRMTKLHKIDRQTKFTFHSIYISVHEIIFPNIPDHFPLSKKLTLLKTQTFNGKMWDAMLIVFSIIACGMYVTATYQTSYSSAQTQLVMELVITQFFGVDFIYSFFAASAKFSFLVDPWTITDFLTIIPVYIALFLQGKKSFNLSIFRFVRILRLVRILRVFRVLGGLSGVRRQVITLCLTLLSLVFMAAGIVQLMENDVKQLMEFKCDYINHYTNWEPSCTPDLPATPECDCLTQNCQLYYDSYDVDGQPSGVRCMQLQFFDAFYFMIVTVATVGYGDISPRTIPSKCVVMIYILTALVLIPLQVNKLTSLLSMTSMYRNPYNPQSADNHAIICGHVSDWRKLEQFFKEFFHPDRSRGNENPEFHMVILSPIEPTEDIRALIYSQAFDSHVSYIIGSVLSPDDMIRARADLATAVFFLCNSESNEDNAKLDDAATVLRTLSVHNFNPKIECYVQVLKPEDRDILKDSDIDVILCLDEYKTALQGRNAICPGFSTLIENLFHTFGDPDSRLTANAKPNSWTDEYLHGCSKEVYVISLGLDYLETLSFEWTLIVEGLYLEFDIMLIGLVDPLDRSVIVNPSKYEIQKFKVASNLFKSFSQGVILCSDRGLAKSIEASLSDSAVLSRIISKMILAEDDLAVRKTMKFGRPNSNNRRDSYASGTSTGGGGGGGASLPSAGLTGSSSKNSVDGSGGDKNLNTKNLHNRYNNRANDELKSLSNLIRISKSRVSAKPVTSNADGKPDTQFDDSDEENSTNTHLYSGVMEAPILQTHSIQANRRRANTCPNPSTSPDTPDEFTGTSENNTSNPGGLANSQEPKFRNSLMASTLGISLKAPKKLSNVASVKNPRSTIESFPCGGVSSSRCHITFGSVLTNHIIVFGATTNLPLFIAELRRPLVLASAYHSILIISDTEPQQWEFIIENYQHVYYMKGTMINSADFNRTNIREAFSVVLLANRDSVTKVEEENLDADTLFAYLKLEKYIPRNVFFTVELTCSSNIAVLNSTMLGKSARKNSSSSSTLDKAHPSHIHENGKITKGTFASQKKLNYAQSITKRLNHDSRSKDFEDKSLNGGSLAEEAYWTASDTHHTLPVFASGRAFVPNSFDSLLCQSFFSDITPALCEKLVCGQRFQSMFLVNIPSSLVGTFFVDVFRSFLSFNIYVLAVYRSAAEDHHSMLPFVYTCPRPDTLMRKNDKLYIFCNPSEYESVMENVFDHHLHSTPQGGLVLQEKEVAPVVDNNASKKRKGAFVVATALMKFSNSKSAKGQPTHAKTAASMASHAVSSTTNNKSQIPGSSTSFMKSMSENNSYEKIIDEEVPERSEGDDDSSGIYKNNNSSTTGEIIKLVGRLSLNKQGSKVPAISNSKNMGKIHPM